MDPEVRMVGDLHGRYVASDTTPALARHDLAAYLRHEGRAELIPDATLLASELITNAVVHAGGTIELRARIAGPGLHVEVTDNSAALPRMRQPGLDGRGLHIVDTLATDWGVDPVAGNGKTTWFTLDG
jgi:anti-sigma regulatory factor (Ser/Thr protein kinase)